MSGTCGAMVTSRRMMPGNLATKNPEYAVLEILVHLLLGASIIEHLWLCKLNLEL